MAVSESKIYRRGKSPAEKEPGEETMKKLIPVLVIVTALAWAMPVMAAEEMSGVTGGGAHYRIVVPDHWNGDLVIWNHGFSLAPVGPVTDLGPLADLQLMEGYAVAASSYQLTGWAVFKTKNDLQLIVNEFKERFGTPGSVILTGASLGGIVTASALEEANLGNVTGAFTFCGAVAGSRNWDGALDLRLAYDAICSDVPGAAIPGGAGGLPEDSTLDTEGMAFRVHACTGILMPPAMRTPEQVENLDRLLAVMGIPENFLLTDMAYVTFAMRDLVYDHGKLKGRVGLGNMTVTYDDPVLNADIERVSPHRGAENRMGRHFTPTGNVGPVRIVSMHTDKDGLVIVENQSEYASVVPTANLTTAIVVEAVPTHCGFTEGEVVAGWESLRAWLAGGPQPAAAHIQGMCQAIVAGGLADGPCRVDPAFVVPDMDERIKPR